MTAKNRRGKSELSKKADTKEEGEEVQALSIRLPVDVYRELREVAFRKNEKMNVIIVNLLRRYLSTEKREK